MPNLTHNYRGFESQKIKYQSPISSRGNTFVAKLGCDDPSGRLLFQTPKLVTTTGIKVDSKGCHVDLVLSSDDKDFYDFFTGIDEYNISFTHQHANEWFKKTFPYEVIEDFYVPTVKYKQASDGSTHPCLTLRIPLHKRAPNINVYNDQREIIDWKRVKPGTSMVAIIELRGLKFLQRELVCDWEIVQLKASIEKSKVNLTSLLVDQSKGSEITDKSIGAPVSVVHQAVAAAVECTGQSPTKNRPIEHKAMPRQMTQEDDTSSSSKTSSDEDDDDIPVYYNEDVFDKEMVKELAKSTQNQQSVTEEELNNRRNSLQKVLQEADEASRKANALREEAFEKAEEIKRLATECSVIDSQERNVETNHQVGYSS
jgi:hypothetical protein